MLQHIQTPTRLLLTGKLDVLYLTHLSDDAVPELVAVLSVTHGPDRDVLEQNLAYRRYQLSNLVTDWSWPSLHTGRGQALQSLRPVNLPEWQPPTLDDRY